MQRVLQSRLWIVGVLVCSVLIAGCSGAVDTGAEPSSATATEGEPSTATATCAEEWVTPMPYPEWPATLTNESVRSFVTEVERAYKYKDAADSDITHLGIGPEPDNMTRLADGWMLRIESGNSVNFCDDGYRGSASGVYAAQYFINESAIYRADANSWSDPVDDPREPYYRLDIRNSSATS